MSYLRVISEVYLHVISESDIRSTYMSYLRVISEVYRHVNINFLSCSQMPIKMEALL